MTAAATERVVAVIGAGSQGRAFALRCARAGFITVLEDVMPAKLRQAREELFSSSPAEVPGSLSFALTVEEAVRSADLAIDFVPDELESKLEIFSLIDRMAPPKTILCTPTLALSISDLASCTYRADRCIALETEGKDLLGDSLILLQGRATSSDTLASTRDWLVALGFQLTISDDRVIA